MAKISFTNELSVSTNVLNLGDYFQAIKPLHTFQCTNTVTLGGNRPLKSGHVYEFEVLFRPRGDGVSSPTKCSSMGFVTYWNNWAEAFATIRYSADAYKDLGMFVRQSYRFIASKDVQPTQTCLWCTIENDFNKGTDNQNIDVYYYRFQDMTDSSIKDVKGINAKIFEMFDSKTNRLFYNFLYGTDDSSHILMSGIRGFNSFQDKCTNLTLSPINYGDLNQNDRLSGDSISFSMQSGQIKSFSIKNVGYLNIIFNGNPNTGYFRSTTFYDSWYQPEEHVRITTPNIVETYIDTTLNMYVYKNNVLVESFKSTDYKHLRYSVVPGDCFYIKSVLAVDGTLFYAKDVYGEYKRIDEQHHHEGALWWTKDWWEWPDDINRYIVAKGTVDSQINNNNAGFGYVIKGGNSTRGYDGLGTQNFGDSGAIIIDFELSSDYDQFISILRSRQ